jgi:hypothetical protein
MPSTDSPSAVRSSEFATTPIDTVNVTDISIRKPPQRATTMPYSLTGDPLLTVDDVARRLNVSKDWVWDHSSRKTPRLAGHPHGGRHAAIPRERD